VETSGAAAESGLAVLDLPGTSEPLRGFVCEVEAVGCNRPSRRLTLVKHFVITLSQCIMTSHTSPIVKKKIGRPRTGRIEPITVAIKPELLARLDAFAAQHGLNRSEAIRRFIEAGLKRSK
jgi:Ribbon-helix-helix protein, copG family